MARFLYHTECSLCGSSDANAIYDDGSSYCFSCCRTGSVSKLYLSFKSPEERLRGQDTKSIVFSSDDFSNHFSNQAVDWFAKYGLMVSQVLAHKVAFIPKRNAVAFRWYNDQGKLILYQTRSMEKKAFFTSENHDNILPIYYSFGPDTRADTCVIVEDCLSSIKIAELYIQSGNSERYDAMPLLGSNLPSQKLTTLASYYKNLVFWMDHDKGKEAIKYSTKAEMLGADTRVLQTIDDPKVYTYTDLKKLLDD